MLRSVLAVVAGIVVLTAVSFAIEAVVPENVLLEYAYGTLSVALGGYVAARLAPRAPLKHALAMGVLQVLLTTLYMFAPDTHISSTWQGIAIAAGSFIAALGGGAVASAGLGQRRS